MCSQVREVIIEKERILLAILVVIAAREGATVLGREAVRLIQVVPEIDINFHY